MKGGRLVKRIFLSILLLLLIFGVRYCWVSFPIATGYGAKVLCSALFVSGRSEKDIKEQDLNFSPLNLATYTVNYKDSSVSASMFGFAKRKAIYRKGLGATLISELSEQQVRSQQFRLAVPPIINADTLYWPMGDKMKDSFPATIDKASLQQAVNRLFEEKDTNHLISTRAVLVVYDGTIIAEKYAPGITKDTRLTGWSMTKSITGALIGLLVKQNKLQIDGPAPVPEWSKTNDPRHAITIKNLLQQSSGLDFEEAYSKSADATRMLFQRADMAAFTASHSLKYKPGTVFYYSSGNSNILSRIVRQSVGEQGYHAFPYEQLFYKLGMYSAVLEPDASGTFVGSSYSYATARDWARFGLLYLKDGIWNNERLLPKGWVQQTVIPATSATEGQYGFQFWLNKGKRNDSTKRLYPHVPTDLFFADGFEGQNVFIIPSKKLVVVRLGLTRDGEYGGDAFLHTIIQAIH